MRLTIFDYGAGNLHSLANALREHDTSVAVESDPLLALDTDVLLLPGVGAFAPAAERLASARGAMAQAILNGLPTVGICLGMQLFFDHSDEGPGEGLGILAGRVTQLDARRIPHIGWNDLEDATDPILRDAPLRTSYYANGFACRPLDESVVTAWTRHEGDRFPAMVRVANAVGVQFHPEKSSADGVAFLRAVVGDVAGRR
jgi:glutamine amidotransferase